MTSRLKHVNPIQLGIVCAVLYFLIAIIGALFVFAFAGLMMGAISSMMPLGQAGSGMGSPITLIFLPFLYAIFGFIGGVITGWLYNIVAGWTGGIELRLESVSTPLEATT
jgi:hypothetical protein